ncbi:MAG: restriction endonuclease subunit S [Ignavibacteriae bacterium]|nr:restriction endonuclease subunit S [Ignavibacteriota bacterium]
MKKYPKYKPTNIEWIGEIPKDWLLIRFRFLINYQKGKNPKELFLINNGNNQIYLTMDFLRNRENRTYYAESKNDLIIVNDDEYLLLWDGANAGEFIKAKNGILSSTMAVLKSKKIKSHFNWYLYKTYEIILKDFTIGMGIPHVNSEFLKNLLFPIPSENEQIQIAKYLDKKQHK